MERGIWAAHKNGETKGFEKERARFARRKVRIAGCRPTDAAGNPVAAGGVDGNGTAVRAERGVGWSVRRLFSSGTLVVRGLRVELLPFVDDRGAVGKTSPGGVHRRASIGAAIWTT